MGLSRAGCIINIIRMCIIQENLVELFEAHCPRNQKGEPLTYGYGAMNDITPLDFLTRTIKSYSDSRDYYGTNK